MYSRCTQDVLLFTWPVKNFDVLGAKNWQADFMSSCIVRIAQSLAESEDSINKSSPGDRLYDMH